MRWPLRSIVRCLVWLACSSLLAPGCVTEQQTARSSRLFEEGSRYYLAQQYAQAASRLGQAAVGAEDPDLRARARLLEGRSYLALRQFHQAEAAFRRGLLERGLLKDLRAGLALGLADSLYGQERYPEAAQRYRELIRSFADLIPADEALFKLGLACQRAGVWEEAARHFARLTYEYPRSPRVEAARRYAGMTRGSFSVQCGAFSSTPSAQRLASELRAKGFRPRLASITGSDGMSLTVVRVGGYSTWAEATRLRARVQAAGFEARIVH